MTKPQHLLIAGGQALLTGIVMAAIGIGFGSAAWAYWTASGTANAGSVATGALDMQVTDGNTYPAGLSGTLAGPGGSVTLTGLSADNLWPGSSVAVNFNIYNASTGDHGPAITVSAATSLTGTLDPADYTVTVSYGGSTTDGATCTGGAAAFPPAGLAKSASLPVCVSVQLNAGAPFSANGASGNIVLTLSAIGLNPQ